MFGAVAARRRQAAPSDAPPTEKIRAYIDAIAAEAEARPHFPPIWLREIAEGGGHLDAATIGYVRDVLAALGGIIAEGVAAAASAASIRSSCRPASSRRCMFFLATARCASKLRAPASPGALRSHATMVVAHVQRLTLAQLEGRRM